MSESGIKVWIHPKSFDIVLSWQAYAGAKASAQDFAIPSHIELSSYQYVGDAVENKHGVTVIFHEDWKKDFELVGYL